MAYSADDVPFLRLLAKSADRSLADGATSVLAGMVLKFDPEELRDDHGRWSAVGAAVHAIEHATEDATHDNGPVDPKRDKLKLAGKIQLDPGERLVGSSKVSDEHYGSVRLAVTEKDGVRSLRIGAGDAAFGTRDDEAGPWTGGPDRHVEMNAERAKLRAEEDTLGAQWDSLPPGPERDAARVRLNELDDMPQSEIYPSGYTAKLDEAGTSHLRQVLADVHARAGEEEKRVNGLYDAHDRVKAAQDKLRGMPRKWTDEEDAEWDRLDAERRRLETALHFDDATHGYTVFAEGSIPGEWADVHYYADLDDPSMGTSLVLTVVPHGMGRDDVRGVDADYTMSLPEVAKLVDQIDALMPASAGKSQRPDLVKWTYNPSQSRVGGRFASGTGSNITSGGDVQVSGRQGGSVVAVKPLNAAAARASSGKPINGAAARLTPRVKPPPPVKPPAGRPKPQTKPSTKPDTKPKPVKPAAKPTPGPEAATRSPHTPIGSQNGDRLTVSHRATTQSRQAAARERSHQAAVRAQQRAELNAVRASLATAKAKAKTSKATSAQRNAAVASMKAKYGIPKSLRHVSKERQAAVSAMDSATRSEVTDRARVATAQAQVAAVRAQYKKGQTAATTAYLNSQLAKAQARVNAANTSLSQAQAQFNVAAKKWRGH